MDDVFFKQFEHVVRGRRSNLHVDAEKPVDPEIVRRLCELAQWAPNHKRTWPCRFAAFVGEGRTRLGKAFVADIVSNDPDPRESKLTKTATKYLRAPVVLVVGSAAHESADLHDENRDAVAASIQTLCLAATAMDLASYWSSPPTRPSPDVLELCGFDPDVQIVGVVYLGWPTADAPIPQRPPADLTFID